MDECVDTFGEATVFSMLSDNSVYWKIKIDDADEDKPPSASHHGLSHSVHMSFGLYSTPGTFQRTMDMIFTSVEWQLTLIYLNDIVVFSKTPQEHINHIRKIILLLHSASATRKLITM